MNQKVPGDYNAADAKIAFFVPLVTGRHVLDIGVVQHDAERNVNPNWLHRAIVQNSAKCIGIDIDATGVAALIEKGYDVRLADAQNFNLGEKFDVVVAGDIIEHLDNVGGFLRAVKNHLKPGGIFAISTPNPFWWKSAVHALVLGHAVVHPQHTCWFCSQTLKQLLERHGYLVKDVRYGTVYNLRTTVQRITRILNLFVPLPAPLRHNTLMVTACVG